MVTPVCEKIAFWPTHRLSVLLKIVRDDRPGSYRP